MTEHPIVNRRLWSGWRALVAPLRTPRTAACVYPSSVGALLMLIPTGVALPNTNIADALASADILDWVKGSVGLIFFLRRRLGSSQGH